MKTKYPKYTWHWDGRPNHKFRSVSQALLKAEGVPSGLVLTKVTKRRKTSTLVPRQVVLQVCRRFVRNQVAGLATDLGLTGRDSLAAVNKFLEGREGLGWYQLRRLCRGSASAKFARASTLAALLGLALNLGSPGVAYQVVLAIKLRSRHRAETPPRKLLDEFMRTESFYRA